MDRVAFDEMIATQDTHWWFRGKRRIVACMIKWLALPYDSRILEIGCGTGGNIETLSRYGRVWALELDDYALDYAARTNSGATIEKGWLPDGLSAVSGREFDVICLLDVLEHVKDDEESLRRIGDLCVGKTKVLITTPAYQWLYSRHDKNLGHQRRYSRKDLCGKLTRNGYDVIYSGYLNVLSLPLMILARLFDRFAKKSWDSGTDVPVGLINGILYRMFSIEALWVPKLSSPFGGSVVALAEKRGCAGSAD